MTLKYPWLQSTYQHLVEQFRAGALHHATLLAGQADIGKSNLAEFFAHRLLCSSDETMPCGRCKSCLLLASGTHPDLTRLTTEEKSRFIKVDQVRAVTEKLAASAQQGGNKVVIIDRADQLNVNAANALLKSLEEPTANTYFVMLANDLDRLLPTVISRCHVQRVVSPSPQQARDWLQGYASNDNEVESALHIARMSPLKALHLLQDGNNLGLPELFQRLTQCATGTASVTQTARQLEKCDLAGEVIPVLHAGLRQAISQRMDAGTSCPAAVNDLAVALLDKGWGIDSYFELLDQCDKAVRLLGSSANPNPTLLLEDILIRLTLR